MTNTIEVPFDIEDVEARRFSFACELQHLKVINIQNVGLPFVSPTYVLWNPVNNVSGHGLSYGIFAPHHLLL